MSRSRRKHHPSDAAPFPSPTRRRTIWLPAGAFVVIVACVAAAIAYQPQYPDPAIASPASAAASQGPLPETQRQKLIGRWQRADANYVLEIREVANDGQIKAAYLNPRPIHVSKARTTSESNTLNVMVELRDRLYPGSYYTLTYDAGDDRLSGVYHHLGVHQEYSVVFIRIGTER